MTFRHPALALILLGVASACAEDKPPETSPAAAEAAIPIDASSSIWKELEVVYEQLLDTGRRQDFAGRMALVSPDYTATLADGTNLTYRDVETRVRTLFSQIVENTNACTLTIESAATRGNEAIVEGRQHCPRKQKLGDGAIHDVYTSVLQTEIWVKTADGWKLRRVENERDQIIEIDGVPSNPDGTPKR